MATVKVDASAARRLLEALKEHSDRVQAEFLRQGARLTVEEMKRKAPVRTGALRRSIGVRAVEGGRVAVSPAVPYWHAVERGAKPRVILPKRGKVLAFEVDGRPVFARRARWPGFPGRFFVRATEQAVRPKLRQLLLQLMKKR